jgi:hypothetical protein
MKIPRSLISLLSFHINGLTINLKGVSSKTNAVGISTKGHYLEIAKNCR